MHCGLQLHILNKGSNVYFSKLYFDLLMQITFSYNLSYWNPNTFFKNSKLTAIFQMLLHICKFSIFLKQIMQISTIYLKFFYLKKWCILKKYILWILNAPVLGAFRRTLNYDLIYVQIYQLCRFQCGISRKTSRFVLWLSTNELWLEAPMLSCSLPQFSYL